MVEFIKTVTLIVAGSIITLGVQILLKWIDRTEKKNILIREKLEQAYELSLQSQKWLSEETSGHSKNPHPFDKVKMLITLYAPELSSAEQRLLELEYKYFKARKSVSKELYPIPSPQKQNEAKEIIEEATLNLVNCHYELQQQIKELVQRLM